MGESARARCINAPSACRLCPRECGAARAAGAAGLCGGADQLVVARAALHAWEEPCLSGTNGSGTIFFSGCPLGCCFCQNHAISTVLLGKRVSVDRLVELFFSLEEQGAHNINLVTPLHWAPWIVDALSKARPRLSIPVVCNTGGYEKLETVRMLDGLVDIYLPDLKFFAPELSARYAHAPDYFERAAQAIIEMHRQVGAVRISSEGLMTRGVMVRHLALPKARQDAEKLLGWLATQFLPGEVLLSLMSQYTPPPSMTAFPELGRRISSFEYRQLLTRAEELGLKGFMQDRSSAGAAYTPAFDLTGV